jgi:hypothetical protein
MGIIHGLRQVERAARRTMKSPTASKDLVPENDSYYTSSQITAGISLLKQLHHLGVYIDFQAVKSHLQPPVKYYG